jgi:hypothetical protein
MNLKPSQTGGRVEAKAKIGTTLRKGMPNIVMRYTGGRGNSKLLALAECPSRRLSIEVHLGRPLKAPFENPEDP